MKKMAICLILFFAFQAVGQNTPKPTTLRGILLEDLRTTHNVKDWFVPIDVAVEGLTAEQASWKQGEGNHSVGQLAYHLWYWNRRSLEKMEGKTQEKFSGNNDDTFSGFDPKKWDETVKNLDQVMSELEKFVETSDDATLQKNASGIEHVAAHNAYHIGEMVVIRKLQGSWNPEKGVK